MFRDLSTEESQLVKKWRAPNLSDLDDKKPEQLGQSQETVGSFANDDVTIRRLVAESHDSLQAPDEDDEIKVDNPHASLAIASPSADMLQQAYDEGHSAGLQASQSTVDTSAVDALVSVLNSLAPQKYQMDSDIEQEIVLLAKAIAKMLIQQELTTHDSVITNIVKKALAQIPKVAESPTVYLSPEDLTAIQNIENTSIQAQLVPDNDLNRGDCRVESGASILYSGLDDLVQSVTSSHDKAADNPNGSEQSDRVDTQEFGETS
ncbi:MAG: flagellar assembly protein FliH [Gammaproteobacteria bacterium]|nr:flagellar assembly protein FliH [Gammaproteobacteria bacterium]